ncbi:hypothetical protein JOM56_014499 [Amanita muscaria]
MSSSAASLGASVWQHYGPFFWGGVSATFFSGMTALQAIVYVKLYHKDIKYLKTLNSMKFQYNNYFGLYNRYARPILLPIPYLLSAHRKTQASPESPEFDAHVARLFS